MKCFVDSNVFISLIQNEFGKNLEFMSYRTKEFFEKSIECFHNIIISKAIIKEICKVTLLNNSEINDLFKDFEDKIRIANINSKDLRNAVKINEKHHCGRMDALHLIIAKKEKCDCVVTWNKKHFMFADAEIKILDPYETVLYN